MKTTKFTVLPGGLSARIAQARAWDAFYARVTNPDR